MKRTGLGHLAAVAAVAVLAAAALVVATPADAGDRHAPRSLFEAVESTRAPSATAELTSPEATASAIARDAGESRHSPLRSFAATLAALVALVALAAARGVRTSATQGRAAHATFDARRRGPPLLRAC